MAMRRCCDWCKEDAVFSFLIPEPAGAVEPRDYTHMDYCNTPACVHNAVNILANHTNSRPYPTPISFVVSGV